MARWYWPFGRDDKQTALATVEQPDTSKDDAPPSEVVILATNRSRFRQYPEDGITPLKYREILRDADHGYTERLQELFDAVAADARFGSLLGTRKLAVAGAAYDIEPGDDSDLGRTIAEDCEAFHARIPNLRDLWSDLLEAPHRGFAAVQPFWASVGGKWDIVKWQAIEQRLFRFDIEQDFAPRIYAEGHDDTGAPLPPAPGMLFHVSREKAGPVVRAGFGRGITKLWVYKGTFIVDMASYLDRFGHPLVQAEPPPGVRERTPEMERIKDAVRSFAVDMGAVVPPGTVLKLIEATNKAATVRDVYIAAIDWCDEAAAVCVLGGELSTGSGEGGLGHGQEAKQHGEVRQDRKEADARGLEETWHAQVLTHWTRWHYGPTAPVPKLCLRVKAPEDEVRVATAQKIRAETLAIVRNNLGTSLSKGQVRQEFELEEPENEDDEIEAAPISAPSSPAGTPPAQAPAPGEPGAPASGPKGGTPDDAEPDGEEDAPKKAATAALSSRQREVAAEAQAWALGLMRHARALGAEALSPDLADVLLELRAASSFEDLRERVLRRFALMDPTAQADIVKRARLMAELVGRFSVLAGTQ